jgi:hypothetical protein
VQANDVLKLPVSRFVILETQRKLLDFLLKGLPRVERALARERRCLRPILVEVHQSSGCGGRKGSSAQDMIQGTLIINNSPQELYIVGNNRIDIMR